MCLWHELGSIHILNGKVVDAKLQVSKKVQHVCCNWTIVIESNERSEINQIPNSYLLKYVGRGLLAWIIVIMVVPYSGDDVL